MPPATHSRIQLMSCGIWCASTPVMIDNGISTVTITIRTMREAAMVGRLPKLVSARSYMGQLTTARMAASRIAVRNGSITK